MSKSGIIIAGIDAHAAGAPAAELGARLASRLGAQLELYSPAYNSQVTLAHFETRERLQHARDTLVHHHLQHLEALAAGLQAGGAVACHAAWDHPPEEALIRRVLERGAGLLVVPLPEDDPGQRRGWSASHWQLVRHCPCPLLLTRGRPWADRPVMVAALDPVGHHARHTELDRRILQQASELAAAAGGTLHAWHAWQRGLRAMVGGLDMPVAAELPGESDERRHREALMEVAQAAGVVPARLAMAEGRPEQALPEYCREHGADLVVMGAVARNPFGRIFLGSTAERVLDRLPCDLLVVKPEAFRTPVPRERWPREEGVPPLGVPGI